MHKPKNLKVFETEQTVRFKVRIQNWNKGILSSTETRGLTCDCLCWYGQRVHHLGLKKSRRCRTKAEVSRKVTCIVEELGCYLDDNNFIKIS